MNRKPVSWTNALKQIFSPVRKKRGTPAGRGPVRLGVEHLSDRIVPANTLSVLNVTTFDDEWSSEAALLDGNGLLIDPNDLSLREAIELANNSTAGKVTINLPVLGADYIINNNQANYNALNPAGKQDNTNKFGDFDLTGATEYVIIGSGAGPVINANGGTTLDRAFHVTNAGATVTFQNVTITGGFATDDGTANAKNGDTDAAGGAILNGGGALSIVNAKIQGNFAVGKTGTPGDNPAYDPAVTSPAAVNGRDGGSGTNGKAGFGGGVYSSGGTITISGASVFQNNQAIGGGGGFGENGEKVSNPLAGLVGGKGGKGGDGAAAGGGAIYATAGGIVVQGASQFTANVAQGGFGGFGGNGGFVQQGTAGQGGDAGLSGSAGSAVGGAIYLGSGNVSLEGISLATNNQAVGGLGASGGNGGSATASNGVGGAASAGTSGGAASGGGIYAGGGNVSLTGGSKVNQNTAVGQAGAIGGFGGFGFAQGGVGGAAGAGGAAQGGGIWATGIVSLAQASEARLNQANGGQGFLGGSGGAGANAGDGGAGGNGGAASGAGVYVSAGEVNVGGGSKVSQNTATGGNAGQGGLGGFGTQQTGGKGGDAGDGGNAAGGAVYNASGTIALSGNSIVDTNVAVGGQGNFGGFGNTAGGAGGFGGAGGVGGDGGDGAGGGLYASGNITVGGSSKLTNNQALGNLGFLGGFGGVANNANGRGGVGGAGGAGGDGQGGGAYSAGGIITISGQSVVGGVGGGNFAQGQTGGFGGDGGTGNGAGGRGGAGGVGGAGGDGQGGGVWAGTGGVVISDPSIVSLNFALGNTGGNGGNGGAGAVASGTGNNGGAGGDSQGGGIYAASAAVTTSGFAQVIQNQVLAAGNGGNGGVGPTAAGGNGGSGGNAEGGGIYSGTGAASLTKTLVNQNVVNGGGQGGAGGAGGTVNGNGGDAGNSYGGGVYAGGSLTISQSRIGLGTNLVIEGEGNLVVAAGNGGAGANVGKAGGVGGGGVYVASTATSAAIEYSSLFDNAVFGASADGNGVAGNAYGGAVYSQAANTKISNSTLAYNQVFDGTAGQGQGGAIAVNTAADGVRITASTVVFNASEDNGGGIANVGTGGVTLISTIAGRNNVFIGGVTGKELAGTFTGGNNLVENPVGYSLAGVNNTEGQPFANPAFQPGFGYPAFGGGGNNGNNTVFIEQWQSGATQTQFFRLATRVEFPTNVTFPTLGLPVGALTAVDKGSNAGTDASPIDQNTGDREQPDGAPDIGAIEGNGTSQGGGSPPVAGTVQMQNATYAVNEADGTLTVTLTRTGGTSGGITVPVTVSGGTATQGDDFSLVGVPVAFADGETTKTFTINIVNDTAVEGAETINLQLGTPTGGATLGAQVTSVVTIADNDQPRLVLQSNGSGKVQVNLRGTGGGELFTFRPFDVVNGGVTYRHNAVIDTALGDVNGDGVADIILGSQTGRAAAQNRGGATRVRIYDGAAALNGQIAQLGNDIVLSGYFEGVNVAAANTDGDGTATTPGTDEVIIGLRSPARGSAALPAQGSIAVLHLDGANFQLVASADPFAGDTGGTFVDGGDLDNDGKDEIIVSNMKGAPQVQALSLTGGVLTPVLTTAIAPGTAGSSPARITALDTDGDGDDEIAIATKNGTSVSVQIFSVTGATATQVGTTQTVTASQGGNVRAFDISKYDADLDGNYELAIGVTPTNNRLLSVLDLNGTTTFPDFVFFGGINQSTGFSMDTV